jgi:hypothetical protein
LETEARGAVDRRFLFFSEAADWLCFFVVKK